MRELLISPYDLIITEYGFKTISECLHGNKILGIKDGKESWMELLGDFELLKGSGYQIYTDQNDFLMPEKGKIGTPSGIFNIDTFLNNFNPYNPDKRVIERQLKISRPPFLTSESTFIDWDWKKLELYDDLGYFLGFLTRKIDIYKNEIVLRVYRKMIEYVLTELHNIIIKIDDFSKIEISKPIGEDNISMPWMWIIIRCEKLVDLINSFWPRAFDIPQQIRSANLNIFNKFCEGAITIMSEVEDPSKISIGSEISFKTFPEEKQIRQLIYYYFTLRELKYITSVNPLYNPISVSIKRAQYREPYPRLLTAVKKSNINYYSIKLEDKKWYPLISLSYIF